jgi:hypothetical protein
LAVRVSLQLCPFNPAWLKLAPDDEDDDDAGDDDDDDDDNEDGYDI